MVTTTLNFCFSGLCFVECSEALFFDNPEMYNSAEIGDLAVRICTSTHGASQGTRRRYPIFSAVTVNNTTAGHIKRNIVNAGHHDHIAAR